MQSKTMRGSGNLREQRFGQVKTSTSSVENFVEDSPRNIRSASSFRYLHLAHDLLHIQPIMK
jgi:hypothetical protein